MATKKRWSTKEKKQRNKAIVQLKKCSWTIYGIAKLLKQDIWNSSKVWKRDKNKYFIPSEPQFKQQQIKEALEKTKTKI